MLTVKCTYTNGHTITTSINGTLEDAERYFIGNYFNLGVDTDNVQRCLSCELLEDSREVVNV